MSSERLTTAEVFYGKAPADADAAPAVDDSAPAKSGTPGEPARSADAAEDRKSNEDVFYADGAKDRLESAIGDDMVTIAAALQLTPEESKDVSQQTAAIFHDLGVGDREAPQYFALYRQAVLEPPSEQVLQHWRIESMRAVTEQYGAQEAQRRIARVQEYLNNNSTLREELNATGLGNHPRIVKAFCEQADRLQIPQQKGA